MSLDLTGGDVYVSILNSDADNTSGVNTTTGYANTFDGQLSNGMSIAFWAKGTVGRWSPFISKYGENNSNGFGGYQVRQQNRGPSPTFTLRGEDQTTPDPVNTADTFDDITPAWQHFAATWDATTGIRKLYVDGQLAWTQQDRTIDPEGYSVADNFALVFGARDNGAGGIDSFFNGCLDEVFIYDNAITETEVQMLASPTLCGDVNLDGLVTFSDIAPFIAVLSSGQFQAEADCDVNGVVNFSDISPFIARLSSP